MVTSYAFTLKYRHSRNHNAEQRKLAYREDQQQMHEQHGKEWLSWAEERILVSGNSFVMVNEVDTKN